MTPSLPAQPADALCDHCGRPEYEHPVNVALGRLCPVSGLGFSRAKFDLIERQQAEIASLRSALERLERNFNLLLRGKPVRDVAETKAEVNAALNRTS